jgi:MoaA/NifB/PqqE/SkfB family radical SAM enzyme
MNKKHSFRKDFRDIRIGKSLKRLFDKRPLQCSLYVTDRCNLSCSYCSEFDNQSPHPSLSALKRRIDKVVELGVIKLALVGGEPLLHPDIEHIIRHAKNKDITVSISTNGFLLSNSMIEKLVNAGLDVVQLSIDRMTPSAVTQKAIERIAPKIEKLRQTDIKIHISSVICEDTAEELGHVLEYGLKRDIPVELRLMHGDLHGITMIPSSAKEKGLDLIELQMNLKKQGLPIHSTYEILRFQHERLKGSPIEWKCLAGYKIFFISADGYFWPCSLLKTDKKIEDVTLEDLKQYDQRKECQDTCGIYCAVSNSLFVKHPLRFMGSEILIKGKQNIKRKKRTIGLI